MDKKPNRLINEKSPYLLQHAYNPIDWYAWSDEAFEKAKRGNKPVLVSIGYSTCHWCHVMERESFEDEEVAALLNEYFVCIKVDREERPDVDQIYMTVCQAMTGGGGWPLTIMMTPEKKPFFAGTYFPKKSKWGRVGIMELLQSVQREWQSNREGILHQSEKITASLRQQTESKSQVEVSAALLDKAYLQLERSFDAEYGGFGVAPKFPVPHNLMFLLRYWRQSGKAKALAMVEKTLQAMRKGGIYDHLGFGFARYSTDPKWLVPHFEKMLYDNALLCYTYLEAYQCTGKEDFRQVAEEIITYVLRDMTSPEGGFYSAEDADSEGVEGKFYVFKRSEIDQVLGSQAELFADFYDITQEGNFEQGENILNYRKQDIDQFASRRNMAAQEVEQLLKECRSKLYQVREQRIHPFKDDKILTAWNGLMIAALAKAARVTGNVRYTLAAEKATQFIFTSLMRPDGRLIARYRDGEAAHPAYLDDYAFLLWALLELYETTFSTHYIDKALLLAKDMKKLFADEQGGGFYFYGTDGEALIARTKEIYDGAIPSGNSVAALAFFRLARLTHQEEFGHAAEELLQCFAPVVSRHPSGYSYFMMALQLYLTPPTHVVIAGDETHLNTQAMLDLAGSTFLPDASVIYNRESADESSLFPYVSDQKAINGVPTAYICQNFACQAPIQEINKLANALKNGNAPYAGSSCSK